MVRLTDRPDMTLDVYRGRKQQYNNNNIELNMFIYLVLFFLENLQTKILSSACLVVKE